ncbi:MAG: Mur ligase family protein, partial [Steroidobacteraceae bacterium]|nr:Mur ligase family protein [Steroidobacteraceae bacterium]
MSDAALAAWLDRQTRTHDRSVDLSLERVRAVGAALGLLPWSLPTVIVGGTNGKGSTASWIGALAQAAGAQCGLFTSPHLRRYQERIRFDGNEITASELVDAFVAIDAARAAVPLTFFEWNTLAALWWFRERRPDLVILEVGLGGRLDATNVVDADVAVLCSVGLDHCDLLGTTRDAIGREKAGIFRSDRPAILATDDMPASVFDAAARIGARLWIAGRDYAWSIEPQGSWTFRGTRERLGSLPLPSLPGQRQIQNAAAALAALEALALTGRAGAWFPTATQAAQALRNLRLEGRLQR